MLCKTTGIVLHSTNYSESSLIVKIYTRNYGLRSFIVSGVRSKKSKNKANLFQPLTIVDLVFTNNERSNLHRLSEITVANPFHEIPYNFVKSSIAILLNEVLYKALKEEHQDEDMFDFIVSSLMILDLKTENCSNFHVFFILQLTRYLGFYPQGEYSPDSSIFDLQDGRFVNYIPKHSFYLSASKSMLIDQVIKSNYESIHAISITRAERKQLLQSLILFYLLHINGFGEIKSVEVLEEVLS
ncbi:MAG: DNA repair protein RecO [Bacteroidetes bacterium]|nr:DNA repair protein RecO [Bacteroidota bacterium]